MLSRIQVLLGIKKPGIGRSTAGAILSIAFEKSATILDGNVKRVLTRFQGIEEWPGEKATLEKLWEIAEKYTPEKRTADYTQAIMDLGATICVRGKPVCSSCPLQKNCIAHEKGIEKNLPRSKPKKSLPIREMKFLIFRKNHFVLLEKRPSTGIWGGLWSLPEISVAQSEEEIKKFCVERFNFEIVSARSLASFRHTFSHFHLDIFPIELSVKSAQKNKIMDDNQQIWYNLHEPATIGLPAPVKGLFEKIK